MAPRPPRRHPWRLHRRYGVHRLVWFEVPETMDAAILRETRLKRWNRDVKLALIERDNPDWLDIAEGLGFEPMAM